jgi:hypothetical protein
MQSEIEKKAENHAKIFYWTDRTIAKGVRDFLAGARAREEEYRALVEAMTELCDNTPTGLMTNTEYRAYEAARQALKQFNEKV